MVTMYLEIYLIHVHMSMEIQIREIIGGALILMEMDGQMILMNLIPIFPSGMTQTAMVWEIQSLGSKAILVRLF